MESFVNYYKILQVGRHASSRNIKASFRKLALRYHPDTTELDSAKATVQMRILLEAYRILMDRDKRSAYDIRFKVHLGSDIATYRDTLRKRWDDPYSRALLIFYDLLQGNGRAAIANYETISGKDGFVLDLLELLGFADYLDCTFLLAEAYQREGNFPEAARLYEEAFEEDLKWNYFRHFRAEVQHRIRNIYCRDLARRSGPAKAIGYYRKLLDDFKFPKKDRAFFHKKIAEAYCELGKHKEAKEELAEALRLQPKLGGLKKIRRYLTRIIHNPG